MSAIVLLELAANSKVIRLSFLTEPFMITHPWEKVVERILKNPKKTYVWVDCGELCNKSILIDDLEAVRFCLELAKDQPEIPCFLAPNNETFLGTVKV
jgi:hypothetical protein